MGNPTESERAAGKAQQPVQITAAQKASSRDLLRARTRLLVCLWTLPVYMVAVWMLLSNQRSVEALMYIYMGMWAGFAIDMVRRNCPVCHKQFFVKYILMSLRTRRCVHCQFDAVEAQQSGPNGSISF